MVDDEKPRVRQKLDLRDEEGGESGESELGLWYDADLPAFTSLLAPVLGVDSGDKLTAAVL
ncbi:hypothetical protein E4U53_002933, partial [Claviceps sorghi]